ncbi:zinc-dependent alcohol dehydrogenase [Allorhizocola rhizosphaerae]|uniref:zinc-dependent alcohol dehydrogenase n=1 Tax=Allorhizocola rhizosphaerae TaxID=1872709 RepID=UPI000E3B9E25|nr:alcohol dehydrogenase catalytic domain-containing protein [Allorhizocola rhizosphaerae]
MLVARLHGAKDIRVGEESMPEVADGHSLVRVTAVGLCGSDLHWYCEGGIGEARVGERPLVLGHEFAGVVEGGPLHGQRVAVDPNIACEACALCLSGDRNLCTAVEFAGNWSCDGGLRSHLAWPTRLLVPLPDSVSDVDGALLEPLGVAIHALDLGHLRIGMSVAVIGCGPIGLMLIQIARAAGASSVFAADPLPHRLAAAVGLGASALTEDAEVDVAFEIGGTDGAVDLALRAARPGARVVLVGIPDNDRTTFTAGLARRKGLTLVMSRRMKDVYPRAIDLVARGAVDLTSLVTQRFPLAEAATAFEVAAARTGLKTVVTP